MVTSRTPSAAMLAVFVFIIAVSARTAASKRLSDALDVSSLAPSSSSSASNSLFSSESSLSLSESGLSEESSLFSGSSESSLGSRSGSSESSRLSSTSSGSLSSSSSSESSSLSSGSSSLSSSSKASSSSLSSVSQSGSSSLSSESSSQPSSSSFSSSSSDSSSYSSSSSSSSSPFPQSPVKPTPPPPPPSDPATAGPSQAEKDAALYRNSGLLKGQTIAMNHNQIKSSSEIKNKVAEEIPELADLRRAKEQHQRLSREEKIKEQAEDAIKSAESAQKETARANKRHQFAVQMERKQRDFQNKIKEERVKAHQATKDLNAELNQKIVQQAMFTRATMKQKKISLFNARVAWKEEVKKTAIRFKHMAKRLKVQSESGKYLPISESSFNSSSALNATSPARFPPVTGNGTATNERRLAATGVRSVPRTSPTQQQQQQRGQQQQQRTNQYQRRNYNQQPSQRQNYQQNYRQQPTQQQNQQYYRR